MSAVYLDLTDFPRLDRSDPPLGLLRIEGRPALLGNLLVYSSILDMEALGNFGATPTAKDQICRCGFFLSWKLPLVLELETAKIGSRNDKDQTLFLPCLPAAGRRQKQQVDAGVNC